MANTNPTSQTTFYTRSKGVQDPNKELNSIPNNKTEPINSTNVNNQTGASKTSISPTNAPRKSLLTYFTGQQTKQTPSINETTSPTRSSHYPELDLIYITSRLIVMKTPSESLSTGTSRSTAELVRELLDTNHPDSYMIYSLDPISAGQLPYQRELYHNKVLDLPLFDEKQTPNFVALLWFCQKVTSFLLESPKNVVALHCADGKHQVAFGACSLLAYHKILSNVEQIVQYYEYYRHARSLLTMSHKRYIQYLCDLSAGTIEQPHFNKLTLQTIHLSPVPLVNLHKTSCRPFIDIYDQEQRKIFSTFDEIAKLRVYSASDLTCPIPIDIPLNGDLTIHVIHAAKNTSRRTHEGGVRICELTINSNFCSLNCSKLSYSRTELDGLDPNGKYPTLFRLTLDIKADEKTSIPRQDSFMQQLGKTLNQPLALFRDENELKQKITEYEKQLNNQNSDVNGKGEVPVSPSPVVRRPTTAKGEPVSPIPNSTPSPRHSGRLSDSFSSISPNVSSFINPFQRYMETSSATSSRPTPPLVEEKPIQPQTLIDPLFDIRDDDSDKDATTTRLLRSSPQSISPSPPPPPCTPITVSPRLHEQSSASTPTKIQDSKKPNNISTSPTQSTNSDKTKPKYYAQNSIDDMDRYFKELGGFQTSIEAQRAPIKSSTINDIRKAVLDKDVDPTVRKVQDWTEGKKRNLRALLSSLSTITWPECGWNGCQMNELLTSEQVTKVFRKAIIHIHPDKLRGDPNEPLAKLIVVELNEAWSKFQEESNGK